MADENKYHVVKWGETLSSIAAKYDTTVEELVKLNNLSDPNKIVVGQKLLISGSETKSVSGTSVTINAFGLLIGTTRTIYVTWSWTQENTEHYRVIWRYLTEDKDSSGNKIWFTGTDSTTANEDTRESTYNAPQTAIAVKVKVLPVAKSNNTAGTATSSWTGAWSTERTYYFKDNPPVTPPVPSVEIKKYNLTAEVNNIDIDATSIEFEIAKGHTGHVFRNGRASIISKHASYSCIIEAGQQYKVRCRACRDTLYSEWSDYSSVASSLPQKPTITRVDVVDKTTVNITWSNIYSAENYTIQYAAKDEEIIKNTNATKDTYFDIAGVQIESISIAIDNVSSGSYITRSIVNQIPVGSEYYVRLRAENDSGASDWSNVESFIIGTKSTAPTTWSSTTTAVIGEPLDLYWMHNSQDGSRQTSAKLHLIVNGKESLYLVPPHEYTNNKVVSINRSDPDKEDDKTYICKLDTNHSEFVEGSKIEWKVCTAGVLEDNYGNPVYGDYSITRVVNIYAPPTISVNLEDKDGNDIQNELISFPFHVKATAGNTANQTPTGYYVSILAGETYATVNDIGENQVISSGTKVYSKYFDISENELDVEISANDVNLENNITYTVSCSVVMSSGLTSENSKSFKVMWENKIYAPLAEIGVDASSISTYIRPYVYGEDIDTSDISLSVYRREFDGSFVELATDLACSKNTFITDPHPSLDYARYRVVAKSKSTGAVTYSDIPGYPIQEKAVIIQWDDAWKNFDTTNEDVMEQPPWAGSMLKLPYNIDVSDSSRPDVSLVKYIGRKRPVSYYGTQLGETSTWNVVIPKSDKETLYAIRRLAAWMGDVYVREPSGSGYWANITVSYSLKHLDLTIPITFNVTRVEGGI